MKLPANPRPSHDRPSRDEVSMRIAAQWELLSTCDRAQVGAVIATAAGRHIGSGYNGAPMGMPHCDHTFTGARPALVHDLPGGAITSYTGPPPGIPLGAAAARGCTQAIHAETNAIAYAARHGVSVEGATIYVTMSPCFPCAQLIIAAGLIRVVYGRVYRDRSGLNLLEEAGVNVEWWNRQ